MEHLRSLLSPVRAARKSRIAEQPRHTLDSRAAKMPYGDRPPRTGVAGKDAIGNTLITAKREANKEFDYKVAAVSRDPQIESLAMKLGADVYIDNKRKNAAEELQRLGGARVIIATAPEPKAMSELIGGLGPKSKFVLIGIGPGPMEFAPSQLIRGARTTEGWAGVNPGGFG